MREGVTLPTYDTENYQTWGLKLRIECADYGGSVSSMDVVVEMEQFNEPPTMESMNVYIFENSPTKTLVGPKMDAQDDEVDQGTQSLTFSITAGNGDNMFKIDSETGQITVNDDGIDYEDLKNDDDDEALYTLTITAEDDDIKNPKSVDAEVKIYVLDVNEAPDKYTKWEAKVNENSALDAEIGARVFYECDEKDADGEIDETKCTTSENSNGAGTRRVMDPDSDEDGHVRVDKFTGGNEDGIFKIDEFGQLMVAKAQLDFETKSEYKLTLRILEAPSAIAAKDYRGNQFKTRDGYICQSWASQEPHSHRFNPEDFPDDGLDYTNGTNAGRDHEKYNVSDELVKITQGVCRDPGSERGELWCYTTSNDKEWDYCDLQLSAEITLDVEINDINEPPTIEADKADLSVDENEDDGATVGKPFIGDDEDDGDTFEYSMLKTSDDTTKYAEDGFGRFKFASKSSGQLEVQTKYNDLNFEDTKEWPITVVVTDKAGLTSELKATVIIKDVNEECVVEDAKDDSALVISEDIVEDKKFGKIKLSDVDANDDHTCKITGGNDDDIFALGSSTFELTVANNEKLDFEGGKTQYTLDIECTDDGGLAGTAQVHVNISDANEAPSVTEIDLEVTENSPPELQLQDGTQIAIKDEDAKGNVDDHSLEIVGGDPNNMFELDGRAVAIGNRGWLYKKDEDSDEYITPRMLSSSKDAGSASVTCPNDEVITFGFMHQFSTGKGLNYASKILVTGATHVKEAAGEVGTELSDAAYRTMTLGFYDDEASAGGFKNAGFGEGGISGTVKKGPTSWSSTSVRDGGVYIVKSGDADYANLEAAGGADYFVALKGRGASIKQNIDDVPAGSMVTLSFGLAARSGGKKEFLEVRAEEAETIQVFPATGGIKNPNFKKKGGMASNGYVYASTGSEIYSWSREGSVAIVENGNGPWGSLYNTLSESRVLCFHPGQGLFHGANCVKPAHRPRAEARRVRGLQARIRDGRKVDGHSRRQVPRVGVQCANYRLGVQENQPDFLGRCQWKSQDSVQEHRRQR